MDNAMFILYEFGVSLVPLLPVLLFSFRKMKKEGRQPSLSYCLWVLVFSVYIIGVYHFTGVVTIYENIGLRTDMENINLIPFSREIDIRGYLLNVLLFMPLGFLIPLIWKRSGGMAGILTAGFLFSVFIELTQLLNYRATDVDDVIMNSLGTLLGYCLFRLCGSFVRREGSGKGLPAGLFVMILFFLFAGRFLLYDEMGLARIIYRF